MTRKTITEQSLFILTLIIALAACFILNISINYEEFKISAIFTSSTFIVFTILWINILKRIRKEETDTATSKHVSVILNMIIFILMISLLILTIYAWIQYIQDYKEEHSYKCMTSSGFACKDVGMIDKDKITFNLINTLGYTINLSDANIDSSTFTMQEGCDGIYVCALGDYSCTDTSKTIEDGEDVTMTLYDCNFQDLKKIKGEIRIRYFNPQNGLLESMYVDLYFGAGQTS